MNNMVRSLIIYPISRILSTILSLESPISEDNYITCHSKCHCKCHSKCHPKCHSKYVFIAAGINQNVLSVSDIYSSKTIVYIGKILNGKNFLRFFGTHGTFDPISCIYKLRDEISTGRRCEGWQMKQSLLIKTDILCLMVRMILFGYQGRQTNHGLRFSMRFQG